MLPLDMQLTIHPSRFHSPLRHPRLIDKLVFTQRLLPCRTSSVQEKAVRKPLPHLDNRLPPHRPLQQRLPQLLLVPLLPNLHNAQPPRLLNLRLLLLQVEVESTQLSSQSLVSLQGKTLAAQETVTAPMESRSHARARLPVNLSST